MKNSERKIEIEFRAFLAEEQYRALEEFLNKNAEDLGEDDKDAMFFAKPDKLLKVVDNVSKNSAAIVLKMNRVGRGSDFEEMEIPIARGDVERAMEMFTKLEFADVAGRFFQKRHNYRYKDVEIALKQSEHWGYHVEFEKVIDNEGKKGEAETLIRAVADELKVKLASEEELAEFTKKHEDKLR